MIPLTFTKSKPSVNTHSSLPTLSRKLFKNLRTSIINLHFVLRRAQLPLFLLVCILVIVSTVFFHISPVTFFANFISHSTCLWHNCDQPVSPNAFSFDARARHYDQAWLLDNENDNHHLNKQFAEIAYFIQVGNDSVTLLPRLFSRIHHPKHVYVVHLDSKVDADQHGFISQLINGNEMYSRNMYILTSEMVTYRAISMVMNTLAAMTLALEKHPTWDYFINLSGADYPLVSPEDQAWLLARPRVPVGRLNYATFFPQKEWVPYSFRVKNMHWDPAAVGFQNRASRLRLFRTGKENPAEKHRAYTFTKAEAWMILSRPFVQFVVRSGFAKRMLVNHAHVLSAPEHYFTDILYNHPVWRKTIVPDALRKVVWYLSNRRSGQHPYLLDGGLTVHSRWEYIAQTRSLFARKFSVPDSQLMQRIDAQMTGCGLNRSDTTYEAFRLDRQSFLQRIVLHFDHITQKTLQQQNYPYPPNAYPKFPVNRT